MSEDVFPYLDADGNMGVRAGDFWSNVFTFTDAANPPVPFDFSGSTCTLLVKDEDGNAVLQMSTADGTIILGGVDGTAVMNKDLTGTVPGEYTYGWKFYDAGGHGETVLAGTFTVAGELV